MTTPLPPRTIYLSDRVLRAGLDVVIDATLSYRVAFARGVRALLTAAEDRPPTSIVFDDPPRVDVSLGTRQPPDFELTLTVERVSGDVCVLVALRGEPRLDVTANFTTTTLEQVLCAERGFLPDLFLENPPVTPWFTDVNDVIDRYGDLLTVEDWGDFAKRRGYAWTKAMIAKTWEDDWFAPGRRIADQLWQRVLEYCEGHGVGGDPTALAGEGWGGEVRFELRPAPRRRQRSRRPRRR